MIPYKKEKITDIIKAMTLEEQEAVAEALPKRILWGELSRRETLIINTTGRAKAIIDTLSADSDIEELENALKAIRKLLRGKHEDI